MVRTQIQLTEAQAAELRRRAAERRTSMAALIRAAVDKSLAEDDGAAVRQRALEAVGKFRSGRSDVSRDHDRYLAEAFAD